MGGPSAATISPQKVFNQARGGTGQAFNQLQNIFGISIPGLFGPAGTAASNYLTQFGQVGSNLAGVGSNLSRGLGQSIINSALPVIRSGGQFTPAQQQQQLNDFRAAMSGSGMNRTNPGVFQQGMNLWNLQQQNLANAVSRGQAGAGVQQTGAGIQATGAGIGAGAIQAPLNVANAAVGDYAAIYGPSLTSATNIELGDLQAQNNANIAAANKQGQLEAAGISSIGNILGGFLHPGGGGQWGGEVVQGLQGGGYVINPLNLIEYTGGKSLAAALSDPLGDKKKKKKPVSTLPQPDPGVGDPAAGPDAPALQKGGKVKKSTDTVPIMATPGEFVLNRGAMELFRPQIHWMNEIGKRHPIMRQGGGEIIPDKKRTAAIPQPLFMQAGGGIGFPRVSGGGGSGLSPRLL